MLKLPCKSGWLMVFNTTFNKISVISWQISKDLKWKSHVYNLCTKANNTHGRFLGRNIIIVDHKEDPTQHMEMLCLQVEKLCYISIHWEINWILQTDSLYRGFRCTSILQEIRYIGNLLYMYIEMTNMFLWKGFRSTLRWKRTTFHLSYLCNV